jgi:hypothetical protein
MPTRRRNRRRSPERRRYGRRQSDAWKSLGKLAGLIGSVCAAILGQAELVGEPWRHYVSVSAIVSIAVWGYCLGPENVKTLMRTVKGVKL